jgi:phosphate:Na+ symporter
MSNVAWFELAYNVVGGLCVFLFGMKALSESLQALASDFIRKVIGWLTANRLLAVAVGTVVTLIVQSSSVTTVMVVGFVNAGLMSLAQAIGVILGANIGTTITGWIVALKVGKYGLVLLALGLAPFFFSKHNTWKNIGKISIALGFIFLGLEYMSGGFKPLTKAPDFAQLLTFFAADNLLSVLACVAVGCGLTFIVQSSSAMLAITIALATTASEGHPPVIGLTTAVALVLGENIGTTITAQLAAIGGNINAKRAAMAHTLFNVLGVTVMVVLFRPFMVLVEDVIGPMFDALSGLFKTSAGHESYAVVGFKIAAAHSLFNVTNVVIFTPFVPQLARLTERLLPDTGIVAKSRLKLLGDVSQVSPELALKQVEDEITLACDVTSRMFDQTTEYVESDDPNPALMTEIQHAEGVTDNIQKEVTIFLTTVLQAALTPEQSSRAYSLLRIADEIESVADYCASLAVYRKRLVDRDESYTGDAQRDLKSLLAETRRLFDLAVERVNADGDKVELDDLLAQGEQHRLHADAIREGHLERVKTGDCNALAGLTFSDMIVALRRIKNHSINMVEARNSSWESRAEALKVLDVVRRNSIQPEGD